MFLFVVFDLLPTTLPYVAISEQNALNAVKTARSPTSGHEIGGGQRF